MNFRHWIGGGAIAAVVAVTGQARAYGNGGGGGGKFHVAVNEPDEDNLQVAANLYYAMIASHLFNWGAQAQATLALSPALEIQGSGMLNLPGSGISLMHGEASAFLGIPWLRSLDVVVSSSSDGRYLYQQVAPVPGGRRKKFGLDGGLFLDRHGVNYFDTTDYRHADQRPVPISSLAAFGGLKWVLQSHVELDVPRGVVQIERAAIYVHVIKALSQSVDIELKPTDKESSFAPWGGRFGFEWGMSGMVSGFVKVEFVALPSVRGPDFSSFYLFGVKAVRGLF
ncbi:MAG: hypothetical protein HYV09_33205 [Deltaproteobacteria bacterium]|nr:hypothetical protein [Deltaproteobacteria bacterium]